MRRRPGQNGWIPPGETIEFMLSPKRDLVAALLFLRLALSGGAASPWVITVEGIRDTPAPLWNCSSPAN